MIRLLAILLCLSGVVHATERVSMRGEEALVFASRLINQGAYGEARAILTTLAHGDPAAFDMRPVDRLAAKLSFLEGDLDESERLLRGLVRHDAEDWGARYDLLQILIARKRDREARAHGRAMLAADPPEAVAQSVRADLAALGERQLFRVDVRAAAAPTSNVNHATTAESFQLFGVLPAQLDDEARATSGFGVSYGVSGTFRPPVGKEGLRGHLGLRGQLTDYGGDQFDQGAGGVAIGLEVRGPSGLRGLVTAEGERRAFGGEGYSTSVGGRATFRRALGPRLSLGLEASALDFQYDGRADRDGPVFGAGARLAVRALPRLELAGNVSVLREATMASSLANTQASFGTSATALLPGKLLVGVAPTVTHRSFDAQAAIHGDRRDDVTLDVTARLVPTAIALGGFAPSLFYRYTDNESSVDLFDYDRHAIDLGFSRSF